MPNFIFKKKEISLLLVYSMLNEKLYTEFVKSTSLNLTGGQDEALKKIAKFITNTEEGIFVLKGYAGTGKTTIISILTNVLNRYGMPVVLLAPTGRAAKVISDISGKPAFTIHKYIYRKNTSKGYEGKFGLNFNRLKNALFIVDEASMINIKNSGEKNIFGSGSLLSDLIEFVFNDNGNKLLLVGDNAQLPPVGDEYAYALSEDYLKGFGYGTNSFELTEVTRQALDSGIINNATNVRNVITGTTDNIKLQTATDVIVPDKSEIWELIENAYDKYGKEETVIITVSNKAANQYNATIRRRIFDYDEEITDGDILMVVKNNYLWTEGINEIPFIANGDFIRLNRIYDFEEKYGFRFADVSISLLYYPDIELDVKLILDTLYAPSPSLGYEDKMEFYNLLMEEIKEEKGRRISKRKIYDLIMENPYFNALEVKFAYAVTCHKAQGGQWDTVFVDRGHFNFVPHDSAYYRWLYTALTRAKERVYLINFDKDINGNEGF